MSYLIWSGLKNVDMGLCGYDSFMGKDRIRSVLTPRERGGPRAFLCLGVSHQVILNERDGQPCDKKPLKYQILKLP